MQKFNTFYDEAVALGADGMVFYPIFGSRYQPEATFTTENLKDCSAYPRSSYAYYKVANGEKVFSIYRNNEHVFL